MSNKLNANLKMIIYFRIYYSIIDYLFYLKRALIKAGGIVKKVNADQNDHALIPLYRLPQGLKRIELEKLKMPGIKIKCLI
jgi:hypothetical protein